MSPESPWSLAVLTSAPALNIFHRTELLHSQASRNSSGVTQLKPPVQRELQGVTSGISFGSDSNLKYSFFGTNHKFNMLWSMVTVTVSHSLKRMFDLT